MRLSISQIRTDGGTQSRAEINQITVVEYANAIKEGHTFPPIVVFYDKEFYWVADGFHRLEASRKAGFKDIEVDLKLGTLREAILYAVGSNAEHGLRRTNEDKLHAVKLLLEDLEWRLFSDRLIAKYTATSHPFVAKVRELLYTGNITSEREYMNKQGVQSTMETSNIGKSRKAPTQSPSWQLKGELLERLQKYQQQLGLDLEATITKLLDLAIPTSTPNLVIPSTSRRWIGFDPGLATVRWAVLEGQEKSYDLPKVLDYGTIETTKKRPTSERLCELEECLVTLLREFQPTNVAMEIPLIGENPKITRTGFEAAGVIQLVCYRECKIIPVHLFPGMWKSHVGDARADSEEVTDTIQSLFELKNVGRKRLDAIGIAYAAFCGVKVRD